MTAPTPASTPSATRRRHVERKRRQGPFVKYVGPAAKRTITAADWGQLNITPKDPKATHTWWPGNDFLVESAQFSDEQLDYLLFDDAGDTHVHDFLEVDFDVDHDLVQTPVTP